MEVVLKAPSLLRTIEILAQDGNEDENTLQERAVNYLRSVVANYNDRWIGIWEKVLSLLWRTIYDGFVIDQVGRHGNNKGNFQKDAFCHSSLS